MNAPTRQTITRFAIGFGSFVKPMYIMNVGRLGGFTVTARLDKARTFAAKESAEKNVNWLKRDHPNSRFEVVEVQL